MKKIIKKMQVNKVYGHATAACIILLVLLSVNSITKGDWNGIFNNIIWLTVACLNFKITSHNSVLKDIIDCQERIIDRICNAIEVAKKRNDDDDKED